MKLWPILVLALTGCPRPGECPETVTTPTPTREGVFLEWSITDEADRLRIDYTVHNDTDHEIYLLDQLIVDGKVDPDAIIVMNSVTPAVVAFVRAPVWTYWSTGDELPPAARFVTARSSVNGTAFTAIPLAAWHPAVKIDRLFGRPGSAILEIAYVDDEDDLVVKTVGNAELRLPRNPEDTLLLIGDERDLPE